jgi:hypothetical protein
MSVRSMAVVLLLILGFVQALSRLTNGVAATPNSELAVPDPAALFRRFLAQLCCHHLDRGSNFDNSILIVNQL